MTETLRCSVSAWGDLAGRCFARPCSHEHLNSFTEKRKASVSVTIIEIRPFRNGWQVFECAGVQPVFLSQDDAISYARNRAWFRTGEIRILDSAGAVEHIIPFSEANRKL